MFDLFEWTHRTQPLELLDAMDGWEGHAKIESKEEFITLTEVRNRIRS
jgi:hypothetical protein